MIGFDDAVGRVKDLAHPLECEPVSLGEAFGRVLASPVVARRTAPQTAVAAMDGYAVREADVAAAPVHLTVIGEAFAGEAFIGALTPGTCVRIFTGAPAPSGADRVIMQEDVEAANGAAWLSAPPRGRRHLREAGSDFEIGDLLVKAGVQLNAQQLVAAAAADLSELEVIRRPRIAIISTGSELREPGSLSGAGQSIPESVSYGVAALVQRWGGQVVAKRRLDDHLPRLECAARSALEQADLVVVIGGASVGDRDFGKTMFASMGLETTFTRVAIKPGKPVWLGGSMGKLVMGLPGNPTSALVTARLFLAPLVSGLGGLGVADATDWAERPLTGPVEACGDRETFLRARLTAEGVEPLRDQDSSAQKALALTDALIRRRPGQPALRAGAHVDILTF
ncbi:MAG: molybdopterin molybdotransferase MoeA [Caulobacter sp.]|nr:molybdopterin molybdotransferase MoeA [Caulobacter sp.]